MAREWLKRSEQCARPMRETHGDGHFMSVGSSVRMGLAFGDEQNKARKILGVILHGFGENHAAVMLRGALSGNSGDRFFLARKNFAHAACGIFSRHAFPRGVVIE